MKSRKQTQKGGKANETKRKATAHYFSVGLSCQLSWSKSVPDEFRSGGIPRYDLRHGKRTRARRSASRAENGNGRKAIYVGNYTQNGDTFLILTYYENNENNKEGMRIVNEMLNLDIYFEK